MPVIEVRDLSKNFKKTPALRDLTLTVEPGEVFGLIGPDGAGKTTLLRVLAGVMKPDRGRVQVCGVDVVRDPDNVKSKIGVVPQNFSLYTDLTVEENLNFFRRMYIIPESDYARRRERLLQVTRLGPFLARRAGQLSGGMQKKLALIASLLHTPELLILDEPTTGVDPVSRRELWEFLYDLHGQGVTIVVSTPYMDEAERCSRVGFLYRGELLSVARPGDVKSVYPYFILEITGSDPEKLRDLDFPAGTNLVDAYPVADALHVVLDRPDPTGIETHLKKNGIAASMRTIEPSFEDAFIAMIRRKAATTHDQAHKLSL
jgi:ABC-2 type transport system ATP-binding protein